MEEFLHIYNDFGKQKKKNKLHKSYQDVNLGFIFNYTTFNSREDCDLSFPFVQLKFWPIHKLDTMMLKFISRRLLLNS